MRGAAPVCVIGNDIIQNLSRESIPRKRSSRGTIFPAKVIGYGSKQGSALGNSLDNWIIIPLTTL